MKKFATGDGKLQVAPRQDEHYIKCASCGGSIWATRYKFTEADGTERVLRAPILTRLIVGVLPAYWQDEHGNQIVTDAPFYLEDGTPLKDLNAIPLPESVRTTLSLVLPRVNLCLNCRIAVLEEEVEAAEHTITESLAPPAAPG